MRNILAGAALLSLVFLPASAAFAQQLRIVEGDTIAIDDPSMYRAYYGALSGEPHIYTFTAPDARPVMFVVLTPDTPEAKTDLSIALVEGSNPDEPIAVADGSIIEWMRFFDTAGRDSYLAGPTIEATVEGGERYQVRIWSSNNDSRYVLVMQGEDPFSVGEILRRYGTVPAIKSDFFGKPAVQAYLTPLLLWPIFSILIVAGLLLVLVIVWLRSRRV